MIFDMIDSPDMRSAAEESRHSSPNNMTIPFAARIVKFLKKRGKQAAGSLSADRSVDG
jgi:hypothetical protein